MLIIVELTLNKCHSLRLIGFVSGCFMCIEGKRFMVLMIYEYLNNLFWLPKTNVHFINEKCFTGS